MSTQVLRIDHTNNPYFNVPEMSNIIYDGKENYDQWQHVQNVFNKDEVLQFNPETINCSKRESLLIAAKQNLRFHEIFNLNDINYKRFTGLIINEPLIQDVHFSMFIPTIETQATEQQLKIWMPRIRAMEILGCYAQTQLGHGSDVRSLETTATYDKSTQEFILNSPSISSAKFWPGELGIFATHGVFQMQLIIEGKKHGIHHFIVPIRNSETYKPFDGITAGDIGPQMAYKSKDNGFLLFQNYRIPRENLLMKYAEVTKEGQYIKNPTHNEKFAYLTMMRVRLNFISGSGFNLLKALTIAIRYSFIRSQFKDDAQQEIQIIQYQTQQQKLYPLLAQAYAMVLTRNHMMQLYDNMVLSVQSKGDYSRLQPMHVLLSACQSVFTHNTYFGIEQARQSCGGHGFSEYSGIPTILRLFAIAPTAEGENTMILMQTAQYLVKNLGKLKTKGNNVPLPKELQYLRFSDKVQISNPEELLSLHNLRKLLAIQAQEALQHAFDVFQQFTQNNLMPQDAFDTKAGIALVDASVLFVHLFTFECFIQTLDQPQISGSNKIVASLTTLAQMYAYDKLLYKSHYLIETGQIKGETVKNIKAMFEKKLDEIHLMSLYLVDAAGFQDDTLLSAIAVQNVPDIYSNLYKWTKTYNRVNTESVQDTILQNYLPIRGTIQYSPKL